MKNSILFACLCWVISVFVTTPVTAAALKKVKVTVPRNSVFILNALGGKDAGIFKKHGIDLIPDIRPFKGHMAGLPAREVMVTTYAGTAAIGRINQGMDLVVIGGGLTVMQEVFVLKNSPFKTISDLKGKKFASWSTGAGAFKATRAAIIDGYGFDVLKDTKFVQAAPPALFKLLERGDVDSMFNISSLTIAAASQPDKYRSIFAPNDYWKKKTGQPIVWSGPLVAWRDWVNEDRARAKAVSKAFMESFKWLRKPENLDKAVEKFGRLAAVKNKAQAATYKKWLMSHRIFLGKWDKDTVNKQWNFLEMAKKHGVLKTVPSQAKAAVIFD
ncbi:ABC transporter substrate-binding protein [Alphaproteobacteria bacterium]|nr:ABC transporter substrate-binding protein [Alphaproteobacteria bacterium]